MAMLRTDGTCVARRPHTTAAATRNRADAEKMLQELAFVLEATRRVKEEILTGRKHLKPR